MQTIQNSMKYTVSYLSTVGLCGLLGLAVAACGDDEPEPALLLSNTSLMAGEGNADGVTFTVKLSEAPGRDVDVAIASSNAGAATVSPATIAFNDDNFNTEQTITITALEDDNITSEEVEITLSATGLDDATLAVTAVDNDTLNIVANPGILELAEDSSSALTVSLSAEPAGNIEVTILSGDQDAAKLDVTSLTFTPDSYDQAQTVTITGLDDDDQTDEAFMLLISAPDAPPVSINVTVADDDARSLIVEPAILELNEEETKTFEVTLSADPQGSVEVAIISSDKAIASVEPNTLLFNSDDFDTAKTVTIKAAKDADIRDEEVVIEVIAPATTDATVNVTVLDIDTQAIVVEPAEVTVVEGGDAAEFTVALAAQPQEEITVTLENSDSEAVSADPTTLTFDATNYNTPQTVTVTGKQDDDAHDESVILTLSAEGRADIQAEDVTVTVTDDEYGN
ncbi:MAG: hypothetical protein MJE77_18350 [Proteobacteria bacterium]|nr:hypothetical protein [Pseudomonadota bacterium]